MGGILGFLGKKDTTTIVEGAVKGLDNLIFSNEERAEYNKKMADSVVDFAKSTMGENTTRSFTRRLVAFAIMGIYMVFILGAGIAYLIDAEYSKFLYDIAMKQNTLVLMVSAFYFGGYYAGKVIGQKEKKK